MNTNISTIPETSVSIIDEVNGTRAFFTLPETADEALKSCLPLVRARDWLDWFGPGLPFGLGVAIYQREGSITLRFFIDGDPLTCLLYTSPSPRD